MISPKRNRYELVTGPDFPELTFEDQYGSHLVVKPPTAPCHIALKRFLIFRRESVLVRNLDDIVTRLETKGDDDTVD